MKCIHCGTEPANRPRGLGHKCYSNRSVRECYPPRGGCGRAGAKGAEGEPTMEELDRMIAEEYPTLPGWTVSESRPPSLPRILMNVVKTRLKPCA